MPLHARRRSSIGQSRSRRTQQHPHADRKRVAVNEGKSDAPGVSNRLVQRMGQPLCGGTGTLVDTGEPHVPIQSNCHQCPGCDCDNGVTSLEESARPAIENSHRIIVLVEIQADLPRELAFLRQRHRHKILYGGRGGRQGIIPPTHLIHRCNTSKAEASYPPPKSSRPKLGAQVTQV